ncbi:hypothetical protein ABZY09_46635 [Streptomyces sp. NPDC002928]|uniref:hypothetical protein n=1 Tax=Streptomyces sp. NPDC002928 TaxID=3154440 RepID=UPI0033B97753
MPNPNREALSNRHASRSARVCAGASSRRSRSARLLGGAARNAPEPAFPWPEATFPVTPFAIDVSGALLLALLLCSPV